VGITVPDWEYLSRYGRLETLTQEEAEAFGREWMGHFSTGRLGQASLYSRPKAERALGNAQLAAAAVLAGGSLLAGPVGADGQPIGAPGLPRPTLDELLKAGLFRRDAAGTPLPDAKVQELRESWATVIISPVVGGRRQMMGLPEASERTTFTLTPTEVTLAIPADIVFGTAIRKLAPATVGIVCSDPDLVNLLTAARAQGAADRDESLTTLKTLPERDWRVAWVQTTLDQPANPVVTPPGRPGMGGPPGAPPGPRDQ
jgi:hypothetical protein